MAEAMLLSGTLDRQELAAWIHRSNGEGPVVAMPVEVTRPVQAAARPQPKTPARVVPGRCDGLKNGPATNRGYRPQRLYPHRARRE